METRSLEAALEAEHRDLDAGTGAGPALGKQLAVQRLHHNLKEERVIYPRADGALGPASGRRLRAFLASDVLPDGWVQGA